MEEIIYCLRCFVRSTFNGLPKNVVLSNDLFLVFNILLIILFHRNDRPVLQDRHFKKLTFKHKYIIYSIRLLRKFEWSCHVEIMFLFNSLHVVAFLFGHMRRYVFEDFFVLLGTDTWKLRRLIKFWIDSLFKISRKVARQNKIAFLIFPVTSWTHKIVQTNCANKCFAHMFIIGYELSQMQRSQSEKCNMCSGNKKTLNARKEVRCSLV